MELNTVSLNSVTDAPINDLLTDIRLSSVRKQMKDMNREYSNSWHKGTEDEH